MSESQEWSFPEGIRPRDTDIRFNLDAAADALVALRAEIPEDAFTASILGTDRGGNGIVIGADGLVLTIGYLITEAQHVWLSTQRGVVVPGFALAYDQASGFGLVRALGPLGVDPIPLGRPADVARGDPVNVISHGGRQHALRAKLIDKREFAGYWEYLVDEALFTAPAHPEWSGAALLDDDGRLIGVGSLLVKEESDGRELQGNMFVPIDLLAPILEPMLRTGLSGQPPRAWLGLYAGESEHQVVVGGVTESGPAARAGIQPGDLVIEVAGERVKSLAAFYRAVWRLGPAGTRIPLVIGRQGDLLRIEVESVDRNGLLARPRVH